MLEYLLWIHKLLNTHAAIDVNRPATTMPATI